MKYKIKMTSLFLVVIFGLALFLACPYHEPKLVGERTGVDPTQVGSVWLEIQGGEISEANNGEFFVEVHGNTGDRKLGTYGILIEFDGEELILYKGEGTTEGAIPADAPVVAANSEDGKINVTGFKTDGIPASTNALLFKLKFNYNDFNTLYKDKGSFSVTVNNFTDIIGEVEFGISSGGTLNLVPATPVN